jgi:hypothetical protein
MRSRAAVPHRSATRQRARLHPRESGGEVARAPSAPPGAGGGRCAWEAPQDPIFAAGHGFWAGPRRTVKVRAVGRWAAAVSRSGRHDKLAKRAKRVSMLEAFLELDGV